MGLPWSDEIPACVTAARLAEMFGSEVTAADITQSVALGLIEPDGARYRVPSPRLLNAGAELVSVGMPLRAVLEMAGRLRAQVDAAASDLARTVTRYVLAAHLRDGMLQGQDIAEVAAITRRVRPLAQAAVDAMLAQSMAQHVPRSHGRPLRPGPRPPRRKTKAATWADQPCCEAPAQARRPGPKARVSGRCCKRDPQRARRGNVDASEPGLRARWSGRCVGEVRRGARSASGGSGGSSRPLRTRSRHHRSLLSRTL